MANVGVSITNEFNAAIEEQARVRGFRTKGAFLRYLVQIGFARVTETPEDQMARLNEAAVASCAALAREELGYALNRIAQRMESGE